MRRSLFIAAAFAMLVGAAWKVPAVVAGIVILVLGLERVMAGVRAVRAFRDWAGLWFAPVHLLRDVAWGIAIGVWTWRRLRRQPARPGYSMRISP